jgi:glycosyltransferase involved in cell wall biosynthesis
MNSIGARPLRIIFVATDLSSGGGVNKAIRDQAALLSAELGAEVTVVNARSGAPSTYPFPSAITVEQHRPRSLLAYFLFLLSLRQRQPDFLVSSWTQDNLLATLAFLFSRTRVVAVEHTSWNFHRLFVRMLRRLVYPLAWRVVVLNPAEQRHYEPHLSNVRLLPNVIAPDRPVQRVREKLIIAVGHLELRKNFADALRAMAASGLEEQGWSLAVIGQGPEEHALRGLIEGLGLTRTTIEAPTSDLGAWYARASLTLVTARLEVFSLVLAEAMQAGVVPIAYATDGPCFILEDFPDHLVAVDNVEALALRLCHIANGADLDLLREKMRKAIERRFSPAVIADRWRALLAEG